MDNLHAQSDPLLLGELLALLRTENFDIGVDDYLRVQHLLNQPGFLCAPSQLKFILCPLFATNEKQQKRFYEIFESHFSDALNNDSISATDHPSPKEVSAEVVSPGTSTPWNLAKLATLSAICLLIAGGLWFSQPYVKSHLWPSPTPTPTPTPEITPTPAPTPANSTFITRPLGQPDDPNWERIISRETIQLPDLKQQTQVDGWARRNWYWLLFAIAVTPLLGAAIWWFWRTRKQRRLDTEQQDKRSPFTWPLSVPKTTQRLHEISSFNATTRLLRRRQQGESLRLDVEATIAATISRLGYPTLQFRPISKVPEYLILIDRTSLLDHQAQFFDDFVARLQSEDIFIERYFYDSDPRICYRTDYRTGTLLEDLPRRGHRLIVYGNGTRFLDPQSGELADWAEWFADWDDRALLSPISPVQWGRRERKLADLFLVLPATLEGLREAITHFELQNRPDLRAWRNRSEDDPLPTFTYDSSAEKTADKLQAYLHDDNLFQWVCACAVYPELQWDLTLCLGEQVMPEGQLWEKDILRLARLPWFQEGAMPDDLRYCLMRRLTPGNQKKVSQKLAELLQLTTNELLKNFPKFNGSWAKETMALQVNIHEWLANRDDQQAKELRRKFSELPPSLTLREYATLREVDAEPLTPAAKSLTQRLPAEWRNRIFPHGIPLLGLKPGVVFASIVPLAILLAGLLAPFRPAAQTDEKRTPQSPKEEQIEVVMKVRSGPLPTPTVSSTPTSSGGIRLNLGYNEPLEVAVNDLVSVALQDQKSKRVLNFSRALKTPVINNLPLGNYKIVSLKLKKAVAKTADCDEVNVIPGKITPVRCWVTIDPQNPPTITPSCFAPQAVILSPEKSAPANTEISLSGTVQGGEYYGELTFTWTASAGNVKSNGVSRASKPIYVLETTGVAPGTNIRLTLNVSSASGCKASAQTNILIEKSYEQNVAQRPSTMPNVIGQNSKSAQARLEALGMKVTLSPTRALDKGSQPDQVVRQEPLAGQVVQSGQQAILYVAQNQEPQRTCYRVRIQKIEVLDTGSGSSEIWGFNLTANGRELITLPETNYYEGKEAQPSGSGSWCSQAGQETEFVITGTRPNKKDPKERTATGNQEAPPTSNSFNLVILVTAPNPTDGKFIVHLSFTPPGPTAK